MLIAGKNDGRFLYNKVEEKFLSCQYQQLSSLLPWLKTNMAACVRLAMVLLLALAVLILYGDLALHIQPGQLQP
jgi:hypothetical protein